MLFVIHILVIMIFSRYMCRIFTVEINVVSNKYLHHIYVVYIYRYTIIN